MSCVRSSVCSRWRAVLVHPERRAVVPVVPPEPILKADGVRKNDCVSMAIENCTLLGEVA